MFIGVYLEKEATKAIYALYFLQKENNVIFTIN